MRYLGRVAQILGEHSSLNYLEEIAVTEILCRSAKHVFRHYLQTVPIHLLSLAISHFLNCFLLIVMPNSTEFHFDEFSTSTSVNVVSSTNKKRSKQKQRKIASMLRNGNEIRFVLDVGL